MLLVGASKKKAKHNAAESLLSLVEGVDIESTVAEAQYAVICSFHFVIVILMLFLEYN